MIGFSIITLNGMDAAGPEHNIDPKDFLGEGAITKAFILQGGMESGKTSVSFQISMPDGKQVIVQTSGDLLRGLILAIGGNEWRWAQEVREKGSEDGY